MQKYISRIIFISAILILFTGCATTEHMTTVQGEAMQKPDPGKALVIFMRPSSYGGAILATIYDDMDYIGTIPANSKIAYQAEPGEHMFMVIGESADFMKADLAPDMTYYARVAARMGIWKARFSFIPFNGDESEADLQEWISETTLMQMNEKGEQWAMDNAPSIKQKHDEYLTKWLNKDIASRNKQTLFKSSGR